MFRHREQIAVHWAKVGRRVSKVGNETLKKPRVNKNYSWGEKHGKKLFNGAGTVVVKK